MSAPLTPFHMLDSDKMNQTTLGYRTSLIKVNKGENEMSRTAQNWRRVSVDETP